jgi:hypothetical protein
LISSGFGGRKALKSIGQRASSGSFDSAPNPPLRDRSARRFAQDDGLMGGLKNILIGCQKTQKSKKSQPLRMTILWEF